VISKGEHVDKDCSEDVKQILSYGDTKVDWSRELSRNKNSHSVQRNLEICLIGSRPHVDINSFRLDRLQAGSSYHHQPTTVNSNRHICKELCKTVSRTRQQEAITLSQCVCKTESERLRYIYLHGRGQLMM